MKVELTDRPLHPWTVLEYVAGNCLFEGAGPPGGIGEATAQSYFRDLVEGLMYLHVRNVLQKDMKPENLLVSGDGHVKIYDFGVSCSFEDSNDEIRRWTCLCSVYLGGATSRDVSITFKAKCHVQF